MLKKMILLSAVVMAASASQAKVCETAAMRLTPTAGKEDSCRSLGFTSTITVTACDDNRGELRNSNGNSYDLSVDSTQSSWVSDVTDAADDMTVTKTVVVIDLWAMDLLVHQTTTDSRKAQTSLSCTGKLSDH